MTAGGRTRARTATIALTAFAAFMHVFAFWTVASYANADLASDTTTLVGITGSLLLSWSLLLSQAMESVTRAFYSRSDLDLILTSPACARKVFTVRMGRIAGAAVAIAVLLAAPFINVLAVLGGSRWLAAYGVVAAMGAVATAAALALTIALFRIIGAKRTWLVAQIVAAVIGAAFVIGLQIAAIFSAQPVPLCRLAIGLDAGTCARYEQCILGARARRAWRLWRTGRRRDVRHGRARRLDRSFLAQIRRACGGGGGRFQRNRAPPPLVA
ncbi:MAG: hypothetical protein WCD25_16985 [Pseudolabrys sp.]